MEYGEERGAYERIGDPMYEKEQWRKIPTERFQYNAKKIINIVFSDMSPNQRIWLESHLLNIPSYEVYNPVATILVFLVLDWNTKRLCEKRFKKITDKYMSRLKPEKVRTEDVLRYGRKWQDSWIHSLD